MQGWKLGLAGLAAACTFTLVQPASTKAAPASLAGSLAQADASLMQRVGVFHHRKREQASYCYPRKWWFYRPYTTEPQNYERCMPYFHYLGPGYGRPAKAYQGGDIK